MDGLLASFLCPEQLLLCLAARRFQKCVVSKLGNLHALETVVLEYYMDTCTNAEKTHDEDPKDFEWNELGQDFIRNICDTLPM